MEEYQRMILAGDIGGTNARLAVLEESGAQFNIVAEHDYASHEYKSLVDIVADFVKERQCIVEHACFAVAGPVIRGKCVATNLPWTIEAAKLAAVLGKKRVSLINDLEAHAYGLTALPESDLVTLQSGSDNAYGNYAVIAAGTGLGEGGLLWSGVRTFPITSEGGHSSFAPGNELEIEIFRYLSERFGGHVSAERILSGPGLRNVYDFFSANSGVGGKLKELASHKKEITEAKDPSAEISKHSLSGKCNFCDQVMDTFISIYGAEAGNLALKINATGGVYIGGGIAPKILPKLINGPFLKSFVDKGRMKPLMETMPVKVILNQKTGLLGAGRCALVEAAFRSETND
jgi:glucokinase